MSVSNHKWKFIELKGILQIDGKIGILIIENSGALCQFGQVHRYNEPKYLNAVFSHQSDKIWGWCENLFNARFETEQFCGFQDLKAAHRSVS